MMKIVYVLPYISGYAGIAKVMICKANWLASVFGYEVMFIVFDNITPPTYEIDQRIKIHYINIQTYATSNIIKKYWNILRLKKAIKDILYHERPDYVHSVINSRVLFFLPKIKDGSKKVTEAHCNFQSAIKPRKGLTNYISNFVTTQIINKSDEFIVLTNRDADLYFRNGYRKPLVIPNPVSLNIFSPSAELKNKQVVALGRLSMLKDFSTLVDIWQIVHKHHPDWILKIYGSATGKGDEIEQQKIEKRIKKHHLEKSVLLMGATSDVQNVLKESSIYVMTSLFEGLPLTLIEAASCGLPLISFDINCGPSDVIEHGVNGYLVQNRDVNDFAKKIIYLISNKDIRISMGKKSIEISKRFEMGEIMNKWKLLYEK